MFGTLPPLAPLLGPTCLYVSKLQLTIAGTSSSKQVVSNGGPMRDCLCFPDYNTCIVTETLKLLPWDFHTISTGFHVVPKDSLGIPLNFLGISLGFP